MDPIFSWLNSEGTSKYKAPLLDEILPDYIKNRKSKVTESTIRREGDVFNSFFRFLEESKKSKSVDVLNTFLIQDKYIPYMKEDKYQKDEFGKIMKYKHGENKGKPILIKGSKSGTIALNLRHLKIFFNWLYEREIISKKIKFKIPRVEKNFKYVGDKFTEEARSIHYDDKKNSKGIYGKATSKQTEELLDEGIEVSTIPWIDKTEN